MKLSLLERSALIADRISAVFGTRAAARAAALFLIVGVPHYTILTIVFLVRDGAATTAETAYIYLAATGAWLYPLFLWNAIRVVVPQFIRRVRPTIAREAPTMETVHFYARRTTPVVVGWTVLVVAAYFASFEYTAHVLGFYSVGDPLNILSAVVVLGLAIVTGLGFAGIAMMVMLVAHVIRDQRFRIDPYHPDGLGGFAAFGYLTIRGTLMFSSGALFLPILINTAGGVGRVFSAGAYSLVVVFLVFVLLAFIGPNYLAAKKARFERARVLRLIGRRLRSAAQGTLFDAEDARHDAEEFEILRQYYDDLRQTNVFPFNPSIFIGLVSSVIFPIAMVLLEIYGDQLFRWF